MLQRMTARVCNIVSYAIRKGFTYINKSEFNSNPKSQSLPAKYKECLKNKISENELSIIKFLLCCGLYASKSKILSCMNLIEVVTLLSHNGNGESVTLAVIAECLQLISFTKAKEPCPSFGHELRAGRVLMLRVVQQLSPNEADQLRRHLLQVKRLTEIPESSSLLEVILHLEERDGLLLDDSSVVRGLVGSALEGNKDLEQKVDDLVRLFEEKQCIYHGSMNQATVTSKEDIKFHQNEVKHPVPETVDHFVTTDHKKDLFSALQVDNLIEDPTAACVDKFVIPLVKGDYKNPDPIFVELHKKKSCISGRQTDFKYPMKVLKKVEPAQNEDVGLRTVDQFVTGNKRGRCWIIANEEFTGHGIKSRAGTKEDLKKLRQQLDPSCDIRVFCDLTGDKMIELIDSLANWDYSEYDYLWFVILTHGTYGYVYGTDLTEISITAITHKFRSSRVPTLRGKPKVFSINACQVTNGLKDVFDHYQMEHRNWIPNESDFVLSTASTPGFEAYRHKIEGSFFIGAICKHLSIGGELLDILKNARGEVENQVIHHEKRRVFQIPWMVHTLRYNCFLLEMNPP